MRLSLLFIIFLFYFSSFALDMNDSMKAKILRVYPRNVFIVSRGLEDGVEVDEHIKLISKDGFIARGLCIKASQRYSVIKIYRVIRPELVSKDTEYDLHSISQSDLAPRIAKLKSFDFSKDYPDFTEKDLDKGKNLQQARIANYDLPEIVDAKVLKEVTEEEAKRKQGLDN